MAAPASALLKPATPEEAEAFLAQNKRWLPDDAEKVFRNMDPLDQRRVMTQGNLSSVRDPAKVLQSRAKKGKELEDELAAAAAAQGAAQADDRSNRVSKPATPEELETFIKANERWLFGEALEILRGMNAVDQKRVISSGTMSGCRDPVAVVQTRAKKARELEEELVALPTGKSLQGTGGMPTVPPGPTFGAQAAALHMFAAPQAVAQEESRFAPPAAGRTPDEALVAGNVCGVGGVVEITKAKYGCGKGQKLKVIGETSALWQFEDGKTAPKNHEGSGWKWVLTSPAEAPSKPRTPAPEVATVAVPLVAPSVPPAVEAVPEVSKKPEEKKETDKARSRSRSRKSTKSKAKAKSREDAKKQDKGKKTKAPAKKKRSSSSSRSSRSKERKKKSKSSSAPAKGKRRKAATSSSSSS